MPADSPLGSPENPLKGVVHFNDVEPKEPGASCSIDLGGALSALGQGLKQAIKTGLINADRALAPYSAQLQQMKASTDQGAKVAETIAEKSGLKATAEAVQFIEGGVAIAKGGLFILKNAKQIIPVAKRILKDLRASKGTGGLKGGVKTTGTPNELRPIEGRATLSEPVDVVTGEVIAQATDVSLPGTPEILLQRSYTSGLTWGSCFGPKWCSTWGQYVEMSGAAATYHSASGCSIRFTLPGTGWVGNSSVNRIRARRTSRGVAIRDENDRVLRFDLEANGRNLLTSIEDRNGNRIRFDYDAAGSLRRVRHSGGYDLVVEGEPAQIRRVSLVAEGQTRELVRYEYDHAGRLSAVIDGSGLPFRYEYDNDGRITRFEDRGSSWFEYRYDEEGRCIEALGPEDMYHYRFQYNDLLRTNRITDSLGGVTTLTYNEHFQITKSIDARGGVTSMEWDQRSNKTVNTDPSGRSTSYKYDGDGNLVAIVDPLSRTTRITYDRHGWPAELTDGMGRRWTKSYDGRGNLVAAGLAGRPPWRYTYDEKGNLIKVNDPLGNSRSFEYDSRGLPIAFTDWQGNKTTVEYDALGRAIRTMDPLGGRTRFRYHRSGKLARAVLPTGAEIHWEYDGEGNLIRRTAANGVYSYSYGPFGLMTEMQKPSGGRLRLDYDTEGRLETVQNEVGEVYRYEYNATGQTTAERDFSGRLLRFEYDMSGLCIKRINGQGNEITFERDKAGQLIAKSSPDDEARFEYDADGALTRASNGKSEIVWERDEYGRVLRERQGDRAVESEYDERGLRNTRRTTTGNRVEYRHDGNGLLVGLALADEQFEFIRDVMGREVEWRARGGFGLRQGYDAMDRVTLQQVLRHSASPDQEAIIIERRYQYDDRGNPTSIWDSRLGSRSLEYDADGRIAVSRPQWSDAEQFDYDAAGRIKSKKGAPQAGMQLRYYSTGGQLVKAGETRYFFDEDGRTIEKREGEDRSRYEWNAEGRLTSFHAPNGEVWRYEYDALGRRIRKIGPRSTTAYLWDSDVIAEEIVNGTPAESWVFEPETFRPLAKQQDGKVYACITDQVGTPHELVEGDGTVTWSAQHRIWGEVERVESLRTTCRLRFQGQWLDEESGLYYNFFRYYEPETGRYLTSDPIGLDGGTLAYSYVHNPLAWVDPFGLMSCKATPPPNRRQAFNQAKDRAGIPRSQQPSQQGTFRSRYPDAVKDNVGTNLNEGNPAAQGRWYRYETPQGNKYIVEHDVDPTQPPHFHAVENKPGEIPIERGGNYSPIGGKHHVFYRRGR